MTDHGVDFVHPTGFDDLYADPPPWDLGRPQQAFLDLAATGALRGRVLDAGCGTGEHALMAADLGLDVTGIDLAATALRAAERKARERSATARFLRWDARHLTGLGEFDTVLDCGLFHALAAGERAAYVDGLRSVLVPGGRFFMLCISDRQPEDGWSGVHRVSREEIEASFGSGWRIDSIEPATLELTVDPGGVRAWLAALRMTMSILQARIETDRASRYLVQFCEHAAAMGGGGLAFRKHAQGMTARPDVGVRAEWSDTRGTVTFDPWGRCTLAAETDALAVRVEAADTDGLHRIRDIITRDLERFSRRDPLTVTWNPPGTPDAEGGGHHLNLGWLTWGSPRGPEGG